MWPTYKPVLGLIPRCRNSMWYSPFWIVPLQTAGRDHKFSAHEKQTKITPWTWDIRAKVKLKALSLTHLTICGQGTLNGGAFNHMISSPAVWNGTVPEREDCIFSLHVSIVPSRHPVIFILQHICQFASIRQVSQENRNVGVFLTFIPFSQLLRNLGIVRASHHTNHHSPTQLFQKLSYFWLNFLKEKSERH